jgi:hypothetical protein
MWCASGEGAEMGLFQFSAIHTEPRFVVRLAENTANGRVRIPIAVTGKWKGGDREFTIERSDLEQIRENFLKKPTGEINVDYEHASEVPFGTGGPVLSAGKIVKIDPPERFNGGERWILYGWYEPTDRARGLIRGGEYRYISPAISWGAKDKTTGDDQGTTLTSVALVNKPFLEDLPQIHLSETGNAGPSLIYQGRVMHGDFQGSELVRRMEHLGCVSARPSVRGSELTVRMQDYAREHGVTLSEALSEVSKKNPGLWQRYSRAVMEPEPGEITVVPAGPESSEEG